MIKAVIFDFGGVLASEGFQDYISEHVAPYKSIQSEISDMEDSVNRGDLPVSIYDDFLAKMTGGKPEALDKELIAGYVIHIDMLRIVQKLHNAGIKVAILSNFPNEWFVKLTEKFHLNHFFDAIFVSSKLHLIKPQLEFFQVALKRLKVEPGETVFVDDRSPYVEEANKMDMHGLVFTSAKKLQHDLSHLGLSF